MDIATLTFQFSFIFISTFRTFLIWLKYVYFYFPYSRDPYSF